jgi:pyruvate formate lyase activating enzyme
MKIYGWQKVSLIDYPGHVATTVFFGGCNLRCSYCHNHSLLSVSPERTMIDPEEIIRFCKARRRMIQGVVLSGGEPTLVPRLAEFRQRLGAVGMKVKLDTNGMRPDRIRAVAPDYLALDVKTVPTKYGSVLQAPYEDCDQRLAESLAIVREMRENAEVRITLAPDVITKHDWRQLVPFVAGVKRIFLQPVKYRPDHPAFGLVRTGFDPQTALDFREELRRTGSRVEIRGEELRLSA